MAGLLPDEGHPRTAVVALIDGMAGAGKTTLAVHRAHRVAHRFPGGSLYVNLRGYDRDGSVMDPSDALTAFLVALGVAPNSVPDGLDARAALYRSVLADRRALIVLDNARDTEQVRPLPPGTTGSAPLRFDDRKGATPWPRTERYVLRAIVGHAAAHGFDDHAWRTACALDVYFNRLGFWHDLTEINSAALNAARATGDRAGQAYALCGLGFAHTQLGRTDQALRYRTRALELFREIGDRYLEADVLRHLGASHRADGDRDAARAAWSRALVLLAEADDTRASLYELDAEDAGAHAGDEECAVR
ncbi:tetratricopeptide repeat protein [Streptomyces sp. TRM 70361]|uniref:tetratricopeptide repeat protein n=1 Tax=Streptomyces sp. TRM 70361 TaxID=3116553 RepID=UPI002E7B5F1E|nr:tetratricopeptide repeat protein [Streptomyces sp. TRM 70361]MEE1940997.1 tetratricopeptide repeat protein [Streptomyces sp. TRM 70361]